MGDLNSLQADPRFKALPPERQQAMLAHLGGSATPAPSEGIGQRLADKVGPPLREGYQKLAGAATTGLAKGVAEIEDPAKYNDYTPVDQLPPFAREVAEFVVPQTPTSAAITAGSMLLPEAGAARVLGEEAGPITRALGTRLGRVAGMTGLGAATGAVSGEGAGAGALQGAGASIPGESAGRIGQFIGSHLGEGAVARKTTAEFGKALTSTIPWVGKLEKGSDFANNFIHGQAVEKAGNLLRGVKDTLSRRTMGHGFTVPYPTQQGIVSRQLPFAEADKLITDLNQHGFLLSGDPRGAVNAQDYRALAHTVRDRIANQLNQLQKGLGDSYLKARRQFDAASTLSKMFENNGLLGPQGLHQPKLIDRMNHFAPDLERSLGKGTAKRLLDVLRRGFVGEGKDIESKAGHWHGGVHLPVPIPYIVKRGGETFDPIGKVPGYIRPSGAPIEAAISNAIGAANKPERGEGVKSLDKSRAEAIAPTPSAASRAEKVSHDFSKGKTPDVTHDLNRGRLSMDEVRKLLKVGAKTDVTALLDHVPLTESIDALEVASPEERQMLRPLVEQKMRAEFSKQGGNKTLMANLAQRMKRLQTA